MSDTPRPERDLDPAALDELSRAFADHQRDRNDVEVTDDPTPPTVEADHAPALDDLEPTEPTPVVAPESAPSGAGDDGAGDDGAGEDGAGEDGGSHDASDLAGLVRSVDDPHFDDPEPTPPVLDNRPIIKIGDVDGDIDRLDPVGEVPVHTPAAEPGVQPPDGASIDGASPDDDSPGGASAHRIIAIDDADLPDAVYVQGSLEGGRHHSVIIIEDDESGDALRPESQRDLRRGIEPRMRERRIAVKRAQGRKRLIWITIVAVILLVVVAGLAVVGSGLFAVEADQLVVTGAVYTDEAELQAVIDDIVGTPALRVDTQAAEERLRAIPWVDDARVKVQFPHAATIEISEREALTTYQGPDNRFRVLDREGRVLDVLDMYPLAYVLVTGPDSVDLDPGEFAPRGYAAASELAKSLTSSVRGRVDHLWVTADGSDLTLVMNNGTQVRFGEGRELIAKLVRLETALSEMRREAAESGGDPDNVGGPDVVINVSTSEVTR